jgi:hypothetical protein
LNTKVLTDGAMMIPKKNAVSVNYGRSRVMDDAYLLCPKAKIGVLLKH